MDISTKYLGLNLKSPLVPSASPLSGDINNVRKMEDAGAGAVVLWSLFEEQLTLESLELEYATTQGTESFPEALTYFPDMPEYCLGPDEYLDYISICKKAVDIPIIASLNGTSLGGWTEFARKMEDAGADALELNIYHIPTDPTLSAAGVEQTYLDIVGSVKAAVKIPVAVKLSPYFTNMANMARRLDEAGANGLVLFNRFYQPDIDVDNLEVKPHLVLSSPLAPQALRLPLTWIGILYGRIRSDLAATSGVHTAQDVLKLLMAGASVTQMCSALLQNGIEHIAKVERDLREWMDLHEYESVQQMQGSMSQQHSPEPSAFERAQYMRALKNYRHQLGTV